MKNTSGASLCYPAQCSAIKLGGHIVIQNRPCKVTQLSTSKTGKHGSCKIHLVGVDIFTKKKYDLICPSTQNQMVPVVARTEIVVRNFTNSLDFTFCLISNSFTRLLMSVVM